jgi:hypothetical protein
MIQMTDILDFFFTDSIVSVMGDWYPVVYSWSVFAILCGFCLCGLVLFVTLCKSLLRCLK